MRDPRRGEDLHNRAISPSIWSCVYNLLPPLLNADLRVCLTGLGVPSRSSNLPAI